MTIIELSNGQQVDAPGNISIVPSESGDNTIFISDEAAKLLPADAQIVSITSGGKEGKIFLEKEEQQHILIPLDAGQNITFPTVLDDD